ncbi:amino acid permease-domain-containing protein [Aspergillus avenaceus]|uniref:Amino acid permease-domain-containing protein n=1 Tax=Aspergillus avenaceus TaxID=36643 RepID=A0A5N6TJX2_ASPAV|nr:amino acid permease-domain-containing protein [Aspergillus avenaceus]
MAPPSNSDVLDASQNDWLPQDFLSPTAGSARQSDIHFQPSLSSFSTRQPESIVVVVNGNDGGSDQIFMDEKDRTVNRRLRGIHVFMITISGVLGVGLYLRSGSILRIGGPAAVLISFTVMGLLAWMVMQCIGEMLALWPVSGALVEFVGTFVDEDLGTTLGIAYWWIYGLTEVVGGSLKILGAVIVTVGMMIINVGGGNEGHIGTKYYRESSIFQHDEAVGNWAIALFLLLHRRRHNSSNSPRSPPRHQAHSHSRRNQNLQAAPIDPLLSNLDQLHRMDRLLRRRVMMTLNLRWDNDQLPTARWLGHPGPTPDTKRGSDSGFVISAQRSGIHGLADLFNVILLITALTCANTNLYVASRTLFGLTRKIYGKQWRWLAFFGKTNSYQVPVRAMFLSCFFLWVPFLYLAPNNERDRTIASLLEVLSQLGSVSCMIVWACECWAFIRFYN